MSYRVVGEFESALCAYTGAKYAVAVNSCSSALLIACAYHLRNQRINVSLPKRTYASVPMAVIHAGGIPIFEHYDWNGSYRLWPLPVFDSARRFTSGMFLDGSFQCVSFQTSKILGLEQGGAVLHDDSQADDWLRRARFDGRLNASEKAPKQVGWHCYMNPSTAAIGLQRLSCLPLHNPDQCGSEAFEDLSRLGIW